MECVAAAPGSSSPPPTSALSWKLVKTLGSPFSPPIYVVLWRLTLAQGSPSHLPQFCHFSGSLRELLLSPHFCVFLSAIASSQHPLPSPCFFHSLTAHYSPSRLHTSSISCALRQLPAGLPLPPISGITWQLTVNLGSPSMPPISSNL